MNFKLNPLYRGLHRRAPLTVLAAVSILSLASTGASAAVAGKWASTNTTAFTPEGSTLVGSLANGAPIHIVVGLSLNNRSQLDQFLVSQRTPGNPAYQHFLSREQFTATYAPSAAKAKTVVDYLVRSGFTNVTLAPNRLIISADGSAATARAAFNTDIAEYDVNGKRFFSNTKPASVPANLSGLVLSVVGLQNADTAHTMVHKIDGAKPDQTAVPFYPTQFPQLYSAGSTPTAVTIPVAIFAEGDMTQAIADLAQFETAHSLPLTPTSVIPTDGGSTDTSGTDEWDIDSQDIVGISGGVKSITFYAGPDLSSTHMNDEFNQIVTDDLVPVINVSIGGCEISEKASGATATSDQIFMEGNAQGQTFFISSGDSGSAECSKIIPGQSWPAISPYVVAVGGTSLTADANGDYASETVWVDAGGGPSVTEPKPSYQSSVTMQYKSRGVPDVALDADPYTGVYLYYDGAQVCCYGGTSLAAPLTTGTWARVIAAHGNLGFPNPILYSKVPTTPGIVHDVTSGNNGKYTATTGWDYASGFGSFNITNLVAATAP